MGHGCGGSRPHGFLTRRTLLACAALVVAIAATITVVVFVVRTVGWPETTRVEVHPHKIVNEAVFWWRRSPTRVAIGFDEITSVDLDNEDGRKLLKVEASGRTLSGDPRWSAPRGSPRNRPAARRPWPRPHHPERRHPNPPPPRRVQLADILIGTQRAPVPYWLRG